MSGLDFLVLGGFCYVAVAVAWGLWWRDDERPALRARLILASPVWPLPLAVMVLSRFFIALARLVVQARPGRRLDDGR